MSGVKKETAMGKQARWIVEGYVTASAFAYVEAENEAEAKEKFEGLSAPSLCHHCSGAGEGTEESGEVTLNGWDGCANANEAARDE